MFSHRGRPLFANAILSPVPDWDSSTANEVAVWGACLALAVALLGWLLIALYADVWPQHPRYVVTFLLASVVLAFGASIAATRGHVRHAQERFDNGHERQNLEHKNGAERGPP